MAGGRLRASLIGPSIAGVVVVGLLVLVLFVGLFISAASSSLGASGESCVVSGQADSEIPPDYVPWLVRAAARYQLGSEGFSIVAGIHSVESNFGRSTLPGVHSGTNSAGAEGPGQFLVESWASYGVDADGDGVKDPYSVPDSVFATANLLHADGAPGDWHGAIFAYNHEEPYVEAVLKKAAGFSGHLVCTDTGAGVGGDALLHGAQRLSSPRAFKSIPARLWVGGGAPESVDARIWPDAVWFLQTFHLRVTAAREAGHQTHGDGTAMDMVPAPGEGWDESARRAAEALGWREECAAAGSAPVCPLVPAIQFVGYNGYPGHGDPAHAGGNAHLHVSWKSSSYGCPGLCAPRDWVEVFPLSG